MAAPQQLLSGLAKAGTQQIVAARITTSNATPTIAQIVRLANNTSATLWINVIGVRTDLGGPGATSNFTRRLRAKRTSSGGATITAIDTIGTDDEDEAATAVAIGASTTDVTVTVTGVAAETYVWDVVTTATISTEFPNIVDIP
jgi:hypothetical protein